MGERIDDSKTYFAPDEPVSSSISSGQPLDDIKEEKPERTKELEIIEINNNILGAESEDKNYTYIAVVAPYRRSMTFKDGKHKIPELPRSKFAESIDIERLEGAIDHRDEIPPCHWSSGTEDNLGRWFVQLLNRDDETAQAFLEDNLHGNTDNILRSIKEIMENPVFVLEEKWNKIDRALFRAELGNEDDFGGKGIFKYRITDKEHYRINPYLKEPFDWLWFQRIIGLKSTGDWDKFYRYNYQTEHGDYSKKGEDKNLGVIQYHSTHYKHGDPGAWFLFEIIKDKPKEEILDIVKLIDLNDPRGTMIRLAEKKVASGIKLAEVAGLSYARLVAFLGGEGTYWSTFEHPVGTFLPAPIDKCKTDEEKYQLINDYVSTSKYLNIPNIGELSRYCLPENCQKVFRDNNYDIFMAVNSGWAGANERRNLSLIREKILKHDRNKGCDWWINHQEEPSPSTSI